MLKNIWSILSKKSKRSTNTSSEKLVLSLLSCEVHSFLCTHAWSVIRKIRKYTRASVSGVSERLHVAVRGAEFMVKSKTTTETRDDLSFFNISSPLVIPEDQVMRTWGSGFSRFTGVQYAKLVSSCKNLFSLQVTLCIFIISPLSFNEENDKNLKTSMVKSKMENCKVLCFLAEWASPTKGSNNLKWINDRIESRGFAVRLLRGTDT